MSTYLRGKVYWTNFFYRGMHIQESTGHTTPRKAEQYEEDRKSEIRKEFERRDKRAADLGCRVEELRVCGECERLFHYGVGGDVDEKVFCSEDCEEKARKRLNPVPPLGVFLEKQFLPFCETTHKAKPNTLRYYQCGAASLKDSHLANVRLDKITNELAQQYVARLKAEKSASTVNMGLRTLRRAIYVANEWGVIANRPKIKLAKGEKQRDRVLSDAEIKAYLAACEQPWKDCATVLLGTGARPGEIFALRWERVQLNGSGGLLQITDGKSKAARRMLPLVPAVYQVLRTRWEAVEKPKQGWVFPADTVTGHIEGGSGKGYHARALQAIASDAKEKGRENPVRSFPPYTFRHTALTRLAESGCDAFTLAKIAGHSSITITQRYCHPQADAIGQAFSKLPALPTSRKKKATTVPTTVPKPPKPQLVLTV
jgi:integrase